jgi:hypothetical protein
MSWHWLESEETEVNIRLVSVNSGPPVGCGSAGGQEAEVTSGALIGPKNSQARTLKRDFGAWGLEFCLSNSGLYK